jgi:hypothetical protein
MRIPIPPYNPANLANPQVALARVARMRAFA